MVMIEQVRLIVILNTSIQTQKIHNAKCEKTAKIISNIIIEQVKIVGFKYVISNCILKLPNENEQDVTANMSTPVQLEGAVEEVIRNLPKVETPTLEVLLYSSKDRPVQSMDDDNDDSQKQSSPVHSRTYHSQVSLSGYQKPLNTDSSDIYLRSSHNNIELSKPNYVGLVNQAMTCYLNSLLQALYMTPEFRNALYNWEYKSSEKDSANSTTSIPYQLQQLFLNLQTSQKTAVETTSLTKSFGWEPNEAWHQHDIQELCRVMFEALEKNFKNTAQADLINRLYEGKINDYVKCLTCNTEKYREDTFLDIPLPVRPFDRDVAYGSVEEALEAFVKYETLEGNNQYFCEKCNKKSNAHKGLKFSKFPYILTLQLKRFDFDQKTYHRIKLNDRVTFPNELNLNTLIESTSNQESPSREEDAGMSVKCDDSITTDSSTMDEDYASSDIPISNSSDRDTDEGIDVSNGISSSSYSVHNNNAEKIREEYAAAKGPYIYELFSIMIHSGSASGGHYYAYIKDFQTMDWLCFNDQIVKPITQTEIQKTYGGGTKAGYLNTAFRSSTNAYMLMYRQIDPERNTLPMKAEAFPPHIKELLEKMKKNEEERNSYHDDTSIGDRYKKITIYYHHPQSEEIKSVFILYKTSMTLRQVAKTTYEEAGIKYLVDFDQCRIVRYILAYNIVDTVYENDELKLEDLLESCGTDVPQGSTLLLDIRRKSKPFESYPSQPIITKVYVIDAHDQNVVDGSKYVRAYQKQTVKEFKQELTKHFSLDPNIVQLWCQELQPNKLLDDDFVFETKNSLSPIKIGVIDLDSNDVLQKITDPVFFKMREHLDNIVTFFVDAMNVTEDCQARYNIPTLEEYYKEKKAQDNMDSQLNNVEDELLKFNISGPHSLTKIHSQKISNYNDFINETKAIDDKEEGKIQETSNSEDSSLSDSDRTLVGDVPEESELDCESALNPTDRFAGNNFYQGSLVNENNESELVKYIRITRQKVPYLWKISMDRSIKEDELKEKLEFVLHIPKDYFKLEESCSYDKLEIKEDKRYFISLGRIRNDNETKIDLYILDMSSSSPLSTVSTLFVKKNSTIGNLRKLIIDECKKKNDLDLSDRKWFIAEYSDESLGEILNNDDCLPLYRKGLCVCLKDTPIYVRKWNRTDMNLECPKKISITGDNISSKLNETISAMSAIPLKFLELCPMSVGKYYSDKIESYNWKADINNDEIDSKTYILYRDARETPKIVTEAERGNRRNALPSQQKHFINRSPLTSSSRREKALRIHMDPS